MTAAVTVEITPPDSPDLPTFGRLSGEVPLIDWSVTRAEDGRPVVSLVFEVSAVHVVDGPVVSQSSPQIRPAAPQAWGSPRPDPREKIPGWSPEPSLGQQVALNAEVPA